MPKAGFKSITVTEYVYDKFYAIWQNCKDDMAMKGVNSFSAYVTYLIEQLIETDKTFAKYMPKIEKVSVDADRIILKDNILNRIVELTINKGQLYCQLCNKKDCRHVGFSFSLHQIYETLNKGPR